MNTPLPLSLIELLILIAGGIMLGITIHFFIVSRRALNASSPQAQIKINKQLEERKLRYLNDLEWRDKEIAELRKRIHGLEENNEILSIESEELREKNKKLATATQVVAEIKEKAEEKIKYSDELKAELLAYNKKLTEMLSRVNLIEQMEEKNEELKIENESLQLQIEELTLQLHKAEKKMATQQQKADLTTEMNSMLDNAYSEFDVLQDKIQKLESQVAGSQKVNLNFIDAQEEIMKLTRMLEEEKEKYTVVYTEKLQMEEEFRETEEKLREANSQRQHMQKQIAYLEELNMDLQSVADLNSSLQSQIKRIGELESMIQMLSEERRK